MSMTVLPLLKADAMPLSPNSTFCTSGVSGTIVKMTSAFDATSAGVLHATAPASSSAFGTALRVLTNSSCPAARKWPAIGAPMIPRPIQPTFMPSSP